MPHVTIQFFGPAKDMAGTDSTTLEFALGDTVGQIAGRLAKAYPKLGASLGVRLAVNRSYVALDQALKDGDEIAVIPPVSGGAPNPRIYLSNDPIDESALGALMRSKDAGALATFSGAVRSEIDGNRHLVALDYDAYDAMAVEQLESIRQKAMKNFAILDALIAHRLGLLELGETSIFVVVAAAHRIDAFEACKWIVDAVKSDVPIWKKNIWADGKSEWVDPTCS